MTIDKNDPKLTAYILGELPEDEIKEVEAAIEQNPALKNEIEGIRKTVAELTTAFKDETMKGNVMKDNTGTIAQVRKNTKLRNVLFSPFIAVSLAAACVLFAVFYTVHFKQELARKLDDVKRELGVDFAQKDAVLIEQAINEKQRGLQEEEIRKQKSELQAIRKSEVSPSISDAELVVGIAEAQMGRPLLKLTEGNGYSGTTMVRSAPEAPAARGMESPGRKSVAQKNDISGGISGGAIYAHGFIAAGKAKDTTMMVTPRIIIQEKEESSIKRIVDETYNSEKNETYKNTEENPFKVVKAGEFSTFSIDVDTASYATARRFIQSGQKVPEDAVRIEEFINYFKYDYAAPKDGKPFAVNADVAQCPWEKKHLLAKIGIKGKEFDGDNRPPLNLVFLVDVSGSMSASNRLPLVIKSLTELVEMLQGKDRIAIVTYAGQSKVALPSVSGNEKRAILDSLNGLNAGGSTAGAEGIKTAYETARKYYDKDGQNRVILCTDGDFNVGETDNSKLEAMIADEAKSGVFLTILGFGMGNYKDERLKILSMKGNGNYGYIDTPEEARKLLVEGLTGTLFAIAKDVKIQVDFNPAKIAGYRLIGYENRKLRDEDFNNDKVDAGEIGAGHTVTALYEIVPAGVAVPQTVDKSRYAENEPEVKNGGTSSAANGTDELLFVKIRYKEPKEDKSKLLEEPVKEDKVERNETSGSSDFNFASGVALFGMLLRHSQYSGDSTFDTVLQLCEKNTKDDKYRKEFIDLVKKAKEL